MHTAKPPLPDTAGSETELTSEAGAEISGTSPVPRVGDLIADKYRVEGHLGRGGMGVVLSARDEVLGRRVALKLLHTASVEATERILREAQVLAQLSSDHIVRVFDFGKLSRERPFIVMEHLNGEDLSKLIARGPVPAREAVRYVLQACDALQEAHARGIVHRDLKPANLFLASRSNGPPRVKVLDFGLSKLLNTEDAPEGLSLTTTTDVMGSPRYMSPEQAHASKDVDARTDIWSLGVILYELLTAQPPFRASSFTDLLIRIVTQEPEPMVYAEREEVPELAFIVMHCLGKDREHRYRSIAELVDALGPLQVRPVAATLLPPMAAGGEVRPRRIGLWVGLGLVVLVAGVVWGFAAREAPVATDVSAVREVVGVVPAGGGPAVVVPPAAAPIQAVPRSEVPAVQVPAARGSAAGQAAPPAAERNKRRKSAGGSLEIGEILPP
jgi:predicted Ser/Thr protein kinase